MQVHCGESSPFSGLAQVDAAAEAEEDEMRGGGGGARVLRHREEEGDGKGRMRKDPVGPIYKERLISGREKRGG